MSLVIVALTLFAGLMAPNAEAETDVEELAKMFSPILIMTKDTQSDYGEDEARGILVLKPEPVDIMGATSAESVWFQSLDLNDRPVTKAKGVLGRYPSSIVGAVEAKCPKVDFSANKFAFLTPDCLVTHNGLHSNGVVFQGKVRPAHYDYPGVAPKEWNDAYLGLGPSSGTNFPNTAYVHTYKRKIPAYTDSVTVIQYFYFYPYNDWWNNHEGDWQRMDVVVSSSDPNTATIIGVEYRFHSVWVNYYKDWGSHPGLTTNFLFDPRREVKLSPGPTRNGIVQYTHPVVYVGAGSHGQFPIGGQVNIFNALEIVGDRLGSGASGDEAQGAAVTGSLEYMTHTGLSVEHRSQRFTWRPVGTL